MNKKEMIAAVAEQAELTKAATTAAIDALTAIITDELSFGNEVTLPGIGIFKISQRAARVGRNPLTGGTADIKAALVPKFKASVTLKKALNG